MLHCNGLKNFIKILCVVVFVPIQVAFAVDQNITINAFGGRTDALPVAYGDFNSDEQTDIFILTQQQRVLSILLGRSDSEPLVSNLIVNFVFV